MSKESKKNPEKYNSFIEMTHNLIFTAIHKVRNNEEVRKRIERRKQIANLEYQIMALKMENIKEDYPDIPL